MLFRSKSGNIGNQVLARSHDLSFRYINDVLSINNSCFGDCIHSPFPKILEMEDTTLIMKSASYLDLHLENDGKEKLMTTLYDKHDELSLYIVNFSFIFGKIPSAPMYAIFIYKTAEFFVTSLTL